MSHDKLHSDHDELHRDIVADIKRDGRSVMCIGAEDDSPAFAYTIGNALAGLPELLMIGGVQGAYLLNDLSQKMLEPRAAFDDGELVQLGGKYPVKIINADQRARDEYTIQAGQHLGHEDYAVQQILIPDRNGRYPDDPECAAPYSIRKSIQPMAERLGFGEYDQLHHFIAAGVWDTRPAETELLVQADIDIGFDLGGKFPRRT